MLHSLFHHQVLGDQSKDIVRSAANAVLETIKNGMFSQLLNLSQKITDYGAEDEEMGEPDRKRKDAEPEVDEEMGVAVVFDEEEQES
ncbi:hypothetical protein OF83DRAFT_1192563, partial [Amylostereum chailletii]